MGPYFGSLLASSWLQHGFQSSQDSSKTTQGASKTRLICLQDRPSTSQDDSKTASSAPKRPLRLSKSLQDGSGSLQDPSRRGFGDPKPPPRALQKRLWRLQAASKSSPEEPSKPPAVALHPQASGLQVASAGCAKRKTYLFNSLPWSPSGA